MPHLRVTVSLALTAQEFLLDAPVISVGKLPDSVLVLPFSWVGETHLIISDDPSGSVRVKAPSDLRRATMNGLPISPEGLLIPMGQKFELTILSPTNEPLTLRVEPAPVPAAASVAAEAAAKKPHVRMDMILGAAVLVGATMLASYLAFSGPAAIPRAAAVPPPTPAQVESRKQLDAAATAYLAGNIPEAKRALAATSETGVVADALSLAIRKAAAPPPVVAPVTAPAQPPVQPHADKPAAPVTSVTTPAEPTVIFEGRVITISERDRILKQRAEAFPVPEKTIPTSPPPKPAGDPIRTAKILEQVAADVAAGKNLKQTDLGKRALQHAKDLVKKQLASDIAFPKDEDTRVIISLADDQIQIRGFCDQFNAQHVPIRVFYLAKLRPLDDTAWDDVGVEMLK